MFGLKPNEIGFIFCFVIFFISLLGFMFCKDKEKCEISLVAALVSGFIGGMIILGSMPN